MLDKLMKLAAACCVVVCAPMALSQASAPDTPAPQPTPTQPVKEPTWEPVDVSSTGPAWLRGRSRAWAEFAYISGKLDGFVRGSSAPGGSPDVDLKDNLGIDSDKGGRFGIGGQFHRFHGSIGLSRASYKGNLTGNVNITMGGATFPAGSPLHTEMDVSESIIDIGYAIISEDDYELGAGFRFIDYSVDFSLRSTTGAGTVREFERYETDTAGLWVFGVHKVSEGTELMWQVYGSEELMGAAVDATFKVGRQIGLGARLSIPEFTSTELSGSRVDDLRAHITFSQISLSIVMALRF